jgi:hypothetical protein
VSSPFSSLSTDLSPGQEKRENLLFRLKKALFEFGLFLVLVLVNTFSIMRTFIASAFILISLSACDVYITEPRYDQRERFVGYYDVEEYSNTYHEYTYYSIHIYKSNYSDTKIYLDNFYGAEISVVAYVSGSKITIPEQVVDGYEIEGTGWLSGNDLDLTYSVEDHYDHSYTDFCDTHAWR